MHRAKLCPLLSAVALALFIASAVFAQQPQATPLPAAVSAGERSTVENFVAALESAKTDAEREALLAARKELMTREAAQTLIARGERLRVQGEYVGALNLHKSALDIARQLKDEAGMARALNCVGRVRLAQNDFKAALEMHEQSWALWMKLGGKDKWVADVFNDMGRAYYALRDYDGAQAAYEKALKSAQESGNKAAVAAALNGSGIVRYYRGDYQQAMEFYQQSLRLSEEIGDKETGSNALNNIALVHRWRGDYRLAVEFHEKSIKLYEELGAKKRLAYVLANLANVFSAMNDHISTIKTLQKSIAISEALDDKPALAMAMNNTGIVYLNQGNYDLALHYFQKSLSLREAVGVKTQTIHVLNSIADAYREQGRYDQALEALRRSLAMSEAMKAPRGIIASLIGIGDVYRAQGNVATAQPSGAPVKMMSRRFVGLPDAEREVHALAELYGVKHSRVYTGADADEARLKREAGRFRILHLATHGVLEDASPLYSHVMLAQSQSRAAGSASDASGASDEDGLLEAWELMQLDLRADMVVLSACETARGRVASGEGMIGLSWALFVAGSPTTIVSQWKVASASTTELMLAFYRHLQGGSVRPTSVRRKAPVAVSKAEALRQASLALLRTHKYAHPFYWAGFVIIGDGD